MKKTIVLGLASVCLLLGSAYAEDKAAAARAEHAQKDKNKDGKLTFEEYAGSSWEDLNGRKRKNFSKKFCFLDRNKNKYLEVSEYRIKEVMKKAWFKVPEGYDPRILDDAKKEDKQDE